MAMNKRLTALILVILFGCSQDNSVQNQIVIPTYPEQDLRSFQLFIQMMNMDI